ncbi:MAG: hypothetical protein FWD26_04085 [Treponema sp.]|nr:hypothetical protein [Treponema sp.]
MKNKRFLAGFLGLILVFGLLAFGCDDGTDEDIWSDVTEFSQVHGTWKVTSTTSLTLEFITMTANYSNYTMTFDADEETVSVSGSTVTTFSGDLIPILWPSLKLIFENMELEEGVTVTINDENYSITTTYDNFVQQITEESLFDAGFQINQHGTKLKISDESGMEGLDFEIILSKQ